MWQSGFAGANVTIPHKLAAFDICDYVDDTARRAGAVNTLVFRDGRIAGSNTDGYGFIANLRCARGGPRRRSGAGTRRGRFGARRCRSAAGCGHPGDRRQSHPWHGPRHSRAICLGCASSIGSARQAALADHALVVNTTPLGMVGHDPLDLDLSRAPPSLAVADNVYVPLETPLLSAARARGLRTVEGLGMLLHQAVPGFHAWFGVEPQVDEELRQFVAVDLPMR